MPSDINLALKIFRKIPAAWHPYIKLARLDRPVGILLLLIPGWWSLVAASGGIVNLSLLTLKYMALFAVGAVLMRAAGCVINDLWDMDLDAQVSRTKERPLANGEISVAKALRFLGVLLGLSLLVLVNLPHSAVVLGVAVLPLVVLYPKMKRLTWWPQLFLGFTFNWGALMGWAAVSEKPDWPCLLVYAGGIFWTLGYDTVYAHQDKEDDILIGVRSTALLLGEKSRRYVAMFYSLSLFFLLLAKYATAPSLLTPLLATAAASQLVWQMRAWEMDDPSSSLRIFKSNHIYGWLVLLMLAI